MEHPQLYRLLLVLALSSLPSSLSLPSADPHPYSYCAPTTSVCGAGTSNLTVSYPFLIDGRPGNCGYEGFGIKCVNGAPFITISKKPYLVKNLDYTNHLITVVDPSYVNIACPKGFDNTTIDPSSLFHYSDAIKNVPIFFQCPSTQFVSTPPFYDIGCQIDGGSAYYRIDNTSILDMPGFCTSLALVPMDSVVANSLENGMVSLTAALQEGFSLKWMPGNGWCDNCISTGGFCGYNQSSPAAQTCYCGDESVLGSCPNKGDSKGTMRIIIGVCTGIGGFILAGVIGFLWYRYKKRKQFLLSSTIPLQTASSSQSFKKDSQLGSAHYHTHIFSYEELQEATDCFDSAKELGDGGFGTVYKGKLRDGRVVAVKRLYENNFKGVGQFMNEVEILSRLRHENLVSLYGCTSHHSRELVLVYEFVANGTVADHLHGPRACEGFLTWPVRMNIAIETTDALAYLHAIEPPVIHRDVKTSNILLDKSYHVKVADFGLSRLFPSNATHVSTAPQGTPGYVDPEYYKCYHLTDKSDVYSLGVVLIELISSKPAVDVTRERNDINLASMAIDKIQKGELDQLVDPNLGYQSDWHVQRMITHVAELAFRCLQSDMEMRPPVKEVLEVLKTIESGGNKSQDTVADTAVVGMRDDVQLLKNVGGSSPDTVTGRWNSWGTTPNASS